MLVVVLVALIAVADDSLLPPGCTAELAAYGCSPSAGTTQCDDCAKQHEAKLKKVVMGRPQLLSLSVEDNMEPTLEWMRRRLDLDATQLRKMVLTHAPLLGLSVEDNLAPRLDWLQTRLDLDDVQLRKWQDMCRC